MQLAAAAEALQRSSRPEDAAALEESIEAGQACGPALQDEVASAQQALHRWQLTTNNEAKLASALQDGTSVLVLARAIQVCPSCHVNPRHWMLPCMMHVTACRLLQPTRLMQLIDS